MKKIIFIFILFIILGCTVTDKPEKVETLSNDLSYFKDRYGICYAAIKSNNSYGNIISITTVTCNKINMEVK